MKMITLTLVLAMSLAAHAAEKAAAKAPLDPHPVAKSFNISGVKSDADVQKISAALMKVHSVTAVTELTPTSGYARIAFDTHQIASSLVAQTIMDQGPFTVSFDFVVPEYAKNTEKLDALFAKVSKERAVKIEATDKAKGAFTLTYLTITPDPSDPRKVGFNYGHLGHAIHDPAPKGMALVFQQIDAGPHAPAAAKGKAKKK